MHGPGESWVTPQTHRARLRFMSHPDRTHRAAILTRTATPSELHSTVFAVGCCACCAGTSAETYCTRRLALPTYPVVSMEGAARVLRVLADELEDLAQLDLDPAFFHSK